MDIKTTTSRQKSVIWAISVLKSNDKTVKALLEIVRMYFSKGNSKIGWKTSKKSMIKVGTPFFEVLTLRTIFSVKFGQKRVKLLYSISVVCFVMFDIVLLESWFISHDEKGSQS